MKRQIFHDVKLVVNSENGEDVKRNVVYQGQGVLIDEGMDFEKDTFEFVVKQATDHSRHNPIIYKGRVLTCRLRKDGRYAVSFFINPDGDLEERLKRVVYETKASFRAVAEDSITREVCDEI